MSAGCHFLPRYLKILFAVPASSFLAELSTIKLIDVPTMNCVQNLCRSKGKDFRKIKETVVVVIEEESRDE